MNFEKKRDLLYLDIMDYMGTEFIDCGLIMSRDVNFRIVEQHDDYAEKYKEFVELYNKNVKTIEIIKKLGVGTQRYKTLLQEAVENGDVVKRDKKIYYAGRPFKQLDEDVYPRLIEMYLDEKYTIQDILEELNLTNWMFNRYRKRGIEEGLIEYDRQLVFLNRRIEKNYPHFVALRNEGKSLNTIRRELGLTGPLLEKIKKKAIIQGDVVK